MNRYSQGKIYKIWNTVDSEIYVGSTCKNTLAERMAQHRSNFKLGVQYKLYQHMRTVGVDNFHIELIQSYPCNSKDELCAREGYWIRQLNASLNVCVAGRTYEMYCQENRGRIRARVNRYYQGNKEQILVQKKKYYTENKGKIDERKRLKIECPCGQVYSKACQARHYISDKHQKFKFQNEMDGLNTIEV